MRDSNLDPQSFDIAVWRAQRVCHTQQGRDHDMNGTAIGACGHAVLMLVVAPLHASLCCCLVRLCSFLFHPLNGHIVLRKHLCAHYDRVGGDGSASRESRCMNTVCSRAHVLTRATDMGYISGTCSTYRFANHTFVIHRVQHPTDTHLNVGTSE